MTQNPTLSIVKILVTAVLVAGISACAPRTESGVNDPYENHNRRVHNFNKSLDNGAVRGGSNVYAKAVPEPVRLTISNVVNNADMPRMVVNDILQGKIEDAAHNTFRFLINSTFGLAGLLDPATDMGLDARDTDFGETLHVWGAGEGAYLELPIIGPSTERDAFGKVVDLALNPLKNTLPDDERLALKALGIAAQLGDRDQFAQTVDSVLYESADSYTQARLLYLQNRRFELGGDSALDYSDPYEDPYYDPYEDLDGQ